MIGNDGRIVAVGSQEEIDKSYNDASCMNVIDAENKVVIPGLVDGHSHPVWSGDRVHEFVLKLAGEMLLWLFFLCR